MALFGLRYVRWLILVAVLFNVGQFYLKWKGYDVSARDFKSVAAKSADNVGLSAVAKVTAGLRRLYPQKVVSDSQWIPISGGGLHLRAQFLLADFTEYIAIFSAPADTSGRSGSLHWSNNTCTVLSGEVARYSDATSGIVKETFSGSQNFRHGQFESYIYEIKAGTHVICYGRGFIPSSAVWAIAGSLANGDPVAVGKLLYSYGRASFDSLIHSATEMFHHYSGKVMKTEL